MKILELQISDMKRISAVEINPATGAPVILTGDNAQGKSSVLDSIVFALTNTGLDDPIRHGRPSGNVTIKLGVDQVEYTVERKVTRKGQYLTLRDARGVEVPKAQTFLNGVIGNYAFDPLAFTGLKPKEQVEALKQAAGLDFSELDAARAGHYASRTEIGRQGKEAKAQFEAMTAPAGDVPAEEVSAVEAMAKLESLQVAARALEAAEADEGIKADAVTDAAGEVARLTDLLESAKAELAACTTAWEKAKAKIDATRESAPTEEEIAAARKAVENVDKTNAAVRGARTYREAKERLEGLRLEHANLERRIEEIDERKKEAVKNADLPLDGLELTDDGIIYNGTFFNQLSTAEQIRISTLVAMAQNPSLKIILIREGALMNRANVAMMAELANERGYQLWIEKFQEEPGDKGLHIVDGSVAFVDGAPVVQSTAA